MARIEIGGGASFERKRPDAGKGGVMRFWLPWYEMPPVDLRGEESADPRPIEWPLPASIPAWWQSGERGSDGAPILCAVVDAQDEDAAKALVDGHWNPDQWRFCESVASNWRPDAGRFPWPKARRGKP